MRRGAWFTAIVLASGAAARADDMPQELHFETDGTYLADDDPFHWAFDGGGGIIIGDEADADADGDAEDGGEGQGGDEPVEPGGPIDGGWSCGQLSSGSGGAFPGFGSLRAEWDSVCASDWELAFGDRGFVMDPVPVSGSIAVTRQIFVPAAGGDFARWADRIENEAAEDESIQVVYSGMIGWGDFFERAAPIVDTSSGDDEIGTEDDWAVFDVDDDGEGQPATAVVWQSEDAPVRATRVEYGWDLTITFGQVPVPAGGRATTLLFAVQANTRAEAAALAAELSELGGASADELDDDMDSLANFNPTEPGAPRVRWVGPFTVPEGGDVVVSATAEDLEGEPITIDWDLDDDGAFDDLSGVLEAPVSATNRDGPSSVRLGLRVADQSGHVTERHATVAVRNVDPIVVSAPATSARTGQAYSYPIVATDFAGDVLGYEVDEGPDGMTISGDGVLSWTPSADGLGPDVPVTIVVSDDDGGTAEQTWTISLSGAPHVQPGGPYTVDEGREVLLAPQASDPEGAAVTLRWDLDGDGEYDDHEGDTATWSAEGIDGPAEGFQVGVEVSDGELDVRTTIPVRVRNAAPEFLSTPPAQAVVDREWVYEIEIIDPGDDEFTIEMDEDEVPAGMVLEGRTVRWTPSAADLETGTVEVRITARDEDGGRSQQDVSITVRENAPPPTPAIKFPDGTQPVRVDRPTIILDNVDDPDGDPVEYFLQIDWNICFCSADLQESGALAEGDLVTQWTPPLALPVAEHTTYYVRRWAADGLAESQKADSLFDYQAPEEPDDPPASDETDRAGCACRTAGALAGSSRAGWVVTVLAAAAIIARRRRAR